MDIFDEVRYSPIDLYSNGPAESTIVSVKRLMIRLNHTTSRNSHFIIAERGDDVESFQMSGFVLGDVSVDEYGIQFKAIVPHDLSNSLSTAKMYQVTITRKGVYS